MRDPVSVHANREQWRKFPGVRHLERRDRIRSASYSILWLTSGTSCEARCTQTVIDSAKRANDEEKSVSDLTQSANDVTPSAISDEKSVIDEEKSVIDEEESEIDVALTVIERAWNISPFTRSGDGCFGRDRADSSRPPSPSRPWHPRSCFPRTWIEVSHGHFPGSEMGRIRRAIHLSAAGCRP
jgi:hypothetical protein